jgi:hypothetical protein
MEIGGGLYSAERGLGSGENAVGNDGTFSGQSPPPSSSSVL